MPRPVGEADEIEDESRFWSSDMESVMNGEPLIENSRELTKSEIDTLSDRKSSFDSQLLEAGAKYLQNLNIDPEIEDADLIVVQDEDDVAHIDEDLDLTQKAAYIHDEDEVLVFTRTRRSSYPAVDPVGKVAHELKHRDQELRYDGTVMDNHPVTEASTQLLNMYRENILEDDRKVRNRIEGLRDSDYPDPKELADETELAAECYSNLRENDLDPEEAMSFMLNEYEERRIDR